MKRILVGVLILVIVLAVVGCSSGGGTNPQNAAINAKLQAALGAQWASQDAVTKGSSSINFFSSSSSKAAIQSIRSLNPADMPNLNWSGPDNDGWYSSTLQLTVNTHSMSFAVKYKDNGGGGCSFTFTCSADGVTISMGFSASEDENHLWSGSFTEDITVTTASHTMTTHIATTISNSSLTDGTGTFGYDVSISVDSVPLFAIDMSFSIDIESGYYHLTGSGTVYGASADWDVSWPVES